MFLKKAPKLLWTHHAREKMAYYRLSEQRVRRVLNAPKRIEEGVAPKTMAAMQPVAIKGASLHMNRGLLFRGKKQLTPANQKESWTQEIWVMAQDIPTGRKIISAWRYPGMTKARSELTKEILQGEYQDYAGKPRD